MSIDFRSFEQEVQQFWQDLNAYRDPPRVAKAARDFIESTGGRIFANTEGTGKPQWEFQYEQHGTVTTLLPSGAVVRSDLRDALDDIADCAVWLAKRPCEAHRNRAVNKCEEFLELVGVDLPSHTTPAAPLAKVENAEEPLPQYITLDKAAALVSKSKRTLEKYKEKMPDPDVEGGGGKSAEWLYSKLRPWLEKEFGRILPERLPSRSPLA